MQICKFCGSESDNGICPACMVDREEYRNGGKTIDYFIRTRAKEFSPEGRMFLLTHGKHGRCNEYISFLTGKPAEGYYRRYFGEFEAARSRWEKAARNAEKRSEIVPNGISNKNKVRVVVTDAIIYLFVPQKSTTKKIETALHNDSCIFALEAAAAEIFGRKIRVEVREEY